MDAYVKDQLEENQKVTAELGGCVPDLTKCVDAVVDALQHNQKVLIAGNGGSAAQAQHIAAEFVGRFRRERAGLPAIALSTDTSILTAVANDYGVDSIFTRQVEALGESGDVLILLSTSGSSPNILAAAQAGRKWGLKVVGFTGEKGEKLRNVCNLCVSAPSSDTARIQEAHLLLLHVLCGLVEEAFFGE